MSAGLVLNRTRQVPAEDTPAFGAIAERFRRGGDLERAVALCRDGLAKFPNHMSARVTLGWALLDMGKYDEAQAELEQVLRRAPDNLAAIRGLAQLHERAENAVVLPLDGPGPWPPEPDTIESAGATAEAAAHAGAPPSSAVETAVTAEAADLIVTGRAPAVEVPAEFAPVALTSPAEMTSTAASEPVAIEPTPIVTASGVETPVALAKRAGFLPLNIQPSRVVRPEVFESIVDEELPTPKDVHVPTPAPVETAAKLPVPIEAIAEAPAVVEPAVEPVVAAVVAPVVHAVVEAAAPLAPLAETPAPVVNAAVEVSTFAAPTIALEPIVDEPLAASTFALPSEPVIDEPIALSGLTGFAGGDAEFNLESIVDDYVPPPADEAPVSEFALSADAPELQQMLSLDGIVEPMPAAVEPVLDAMIEPVVDVAIGPASMAEVAQPLVASHAVESVIEQAVESQAAAPAVEQAVEVLDPFAFRLSPPEMADVSDAVAETASVEDIAVVPEGVLAFDFETPAPVVVEEKPLAEVLPFTAHRHAARLVALERFLSRVEQRRLAVAAQPLAG